MKRSYAQKHEQILGFIQGWQLNHDTRCSLRTIAEAINLAPTTVRRYRNQMVRLGLIQLLPLAAPEKKHLTVREREVLTLLAEGNTTEQIAYQLGIAKRTVNTHVKSLKDFLGAETRAHIITLAHYQGIL